MQFRIEQVALCPRDPVAAIALLTAMGLGEWSRDHVVASGLVNRRYPRTNEADLAFNYQAMETEVKGFGGAVEGETIPGGELEVLHYTAGDNWMAGYPASVSHLGMHCSDKELEEWRMFFAERNIHAIQEVDTSSHTNPAIAGKRWYHYCIFDTRDILGVDIKFIVRRDTQEPA